MLGFFGGHCKQRIKDEIENKPPHVANSNIVINRDSVANLTGSNMIFAEADVAIEEAAKVIRAAANAMGLTPTEMQAIA